MIVRLGGDHWTIEPADNLELDGDLGECDRGLKRIRINGDARGLLELDTITHELMHALFPYLDEETVESAATDLSRALWKVGYRCDRIK